MAAVDRSIDGADRVKPRGRAAIVRWIPPHDGPASSTAPPATAAPAAPAITISSSPATTARRQRRHRGDHGSEARPGEHSGQPSRARGTGTSSSRAATTSTTWAPRLGFRREAHGGRTRRSPRPARRRASRSRARRWWPRGPGAAARSCAGRHAEPQVGVRSGGGCEANDVVVNAVTPRSGRRNRSPARAGGQVGDHATDSSRLMAAVFLEQPGPRRRGRVAEVEAHREAVELASGSGNVPSSLDRVLGGDHEERPGHGSRTPSTVTWRSSITSSNADCVFGRAAVDLVGEHHVGEDRASRKPKFRRPAARTPSRR